MSDLKPGRELDALIAEKVMGLSLFDPSPFWGKDHVHGQKHVDRCAICGARTHTESTQSAEVLGLTPTGKLDHWFEPVPLPIYSTDIAAAWQVVDHLTKQDIHLNVIHHDSSAGAFKLPPGWACSITSRERGEIAFGISAPHAICLAALKLVNPECAEGPVDPSPL